uniref:Integrase catalytic domain-containing protein n=1 Tax=Rhizophagus irregularis (strain DAOM 181602 / DAOM 197198 / MUCL 43194) TaxID=747089 RepID=U9TPI3_RHIID
MGSVSKRFLVSRTRNYPCGTSEIFRTNLVGYNHIKYNILDVASRYKASIPIGSTSVKNREGILTSRTISKAFEQIYDNPDSPLVWPKLLITDKGSEFKGDCERLMRQHGVEIQKATSKRSVGIVERFIREELLLVNDGVDLPPESILHQ